MSCYNPKKGFPVGLTKNAKVKISNLYGDTRILNYFTKKTN